jgi:general secretion pathway protein K
VRRTLSDERGLALVIVLLVLALLLTIAGEFALAMRLEGRTTLNFAASIAAGHLAEAGYQRAVAEILRAAGPPGSRPAVYIEKETGLLVFGRSSAPGLLAKPPSREDLPLGPGRFSYRIDDEGGRINVNTSVGSFRDLLAAMEVSREVRDVIADSLEDWRDGNENYRLNGAESDYYRGLPVPYKAKNRAFDSLEELLLVKGVTPQIFYGTPERKGLVEYLTVFSTGINVNTAEAPVLRAMGLAEVQVGQIQEHRPYLDTAALGAFPVGTARDISVTSRFFRIEATGEIPGQGKRTLFAIVERPQAQGGIPKVTVKNWRWLREDDTPR